MTKTLPYFKKNYWIMALVMIALESYGQSPATYNANGIFTVPAGVTSLTVEAWGAGGRGATRTGNNTRGGGGGGGAYARGTVSVSAADSPYTIMVGLGSSTETAGEDSWFGSTTTVMAKGGNSAADNSNTGAAGGLLGASVGNLDRRSGGRGADQFNGIAGVGAFAGGGGSSGASANNGNNATVQAGANAPGNGGDGGNGANANANGSPGMQPGGGGGGAWRTSNTRNGGTGGNGRVIVSWTCPTYNLTSITTPSPLCTGTTATVTLNSTVAQLPEGDYTISYTISAPNAGTFTANVTVVAGTASFTTPALNNAGSTTITVTTISSGTAPSICSSSVNFSTTIVVNQQPVIATTTPASRVGIGSVTLGATASIGNVRWYANPTGGTILATATSYTTPVLLTTTTYYVEAVNTGCISTPRVPVIATIDLPEITVSGNGFNIPDEDTTPIVTDNTNFGTVNLTVASTKTYTIENTGTINLTIGSISISGLNASEFVVTTAPAAVVSPGGSTTFNITFTPTIAGNRVASVSFTTNDADENPFNFDIGGTGGTGLTPEINLRGNGNDIIDGTSVPVATNNTAFGSTAVGTPLLKVFTIQNTGTGPLLLTGTPSVSISGSTAFTVSSPPPSTSIPAGGSANFTVTFTPSVAGTFVAIVTIENNDTDESTYDYVINGTATVTGREIDVQGNQISVIAGDTTPSIIDQTDFGTTNTSIPIKLPFDVYSLGTTSLTLGSVSITGTNAAQFTVTPITGTLSTGTPRTFVITFTPTSSLGIKTATVTLTSNDPDEGTYSFAIRAEVITSAAQTVAPGGVTGSLRFWLKADSNIGTVADNTALTNWIDQTTASTKNAISRFTKEPRYRDAAGFNVNFNPVVQFNGNNWMSGSQGFNNIDMFIVIKPTSTFSRSTSPQDIYSGDDVTINQNNDVTGFQIGNTSSRHTNDVLAYNQSNESAFGIAELSTTKTYNTVNIFNPRKTSSGTLPMEIINNGALLSTTSVLTSTYSDMTNTRYWLGRSEPYDASFNGAILEVINYDSRNSDANRSRIESYLAIKYGITLGTNGTSLPYVNSAGTTIYGANQGYNYNIAGIGRDDNSQLNQKQSKSENTASDITIGLGDIFATNSANTNTFSADRTFLMWGHNNNTLAAQAPIVVNMSSGTTPALTTNVDFVAVGRTWRVIENGSIGTVKVSIPSVMLTATITPPGDFLMFVSDSPIFSPTAEYRIMNMNGSNLEASYDFNGTKYITFGYAPERTFVRSVDFDGNDDYMDAGNVLNLPSNYTISAWVRKARNNRTILSKRNAALTEGYDLSINSAGRAEMTWFNSSTRTLTSSVVLPDNIWHHVAVIYNGATATMYIDGVADTSLTAPGVITNTQSFLIGAANNGASPNRFFDGNIDEVRVWSTALTVNQLRYSMNQEILRNGTLTNGVIIPNNITLNEISAIPWSSLSAYYPMSTYTYTNAKDISNNNFTAAIKNLNTVDYQTAPLPYESAANGNWETATTWTNNTVQDRPNSPSLVNAATIVDWNIVRTNHNINSTGNKTVLGLFVNSNILTASNNSKIEVTNYLRLDGKIDLVGLSQLVQKTGSDLDILSSGTLERDQQGQSNLYNYNYWGSPVGAVNTITNNATHTVAGVLRDGTNASSPALFQWTSSLNANNATIPRTLSRYWINKFDNQTNAYANWSRITETDPLRAGQGFTLKGTGAATATQNLVFVGKPNNGTITNTVGKEQLLLVANPYPSALDAVKFINDNLGGSNDVITGSLYFWEHYTTNNSHFLKQYQGGYGVRNLSGGAAPSSDDLTTISGFGVTSKAAPNQFIPVGQGFFVIGNESGASTNLQFNNSQREFIKEDNAQSQTMYRTSSSKAPVKDHWTDNSDTKIEPGSNKKIHIGFNLLSNNFHRQVLLAFMDEKANNDINPGYDALNIDGSPSDMYLLNKDKMLIIQGEGYFNKEASYPIVVKMEEEGKVSFVIDKLENFDADQNYFIYDAQTDTYNSIKKGPFEVLVAKGEHKTRFALHFTDKKAATVIEDPNATNNKIEAIFTRYNNTLNITNGVKDATIETVQLYNIQGACIKTWDIKDKTQFYHKLPITENSSEFYIVKIKTSKGIMTQKIIVK